MNQQEGIYHVATDTFVYPITTKNKAEEQCETCPSCGEMTHLEGHEEGQYYQAQCNNGVCDKFGMTQKFPYNHKCKGIISGKIYLHGYKRPWTVKAKNNRYAICTKPYNPKRTVIYTIIDFYEKIRGTENLVFGLGAETDQQCVEMLDRITSGETEISARNRVPLILTTPSTS